MKRQQIWHVVRLTIFNVCSRTLRESVYQNISEDGECLWLLLNYSQAISK